jgi:hypothetical protein
MSGFAVGALVVAAIGTGVSAYSSYEQGQNAAAMDRYNAAQQAAQNQNQLQASAQKALAERQNNERAAAQSEALYAASGVVTNSGSPLTVQAKNASRREMKALDTDYEGAMADRYGQSQITSDNMQAAYSVQTADLTAAGTILQGAGKAAGGAYSSLGTGGSTQSYSDWANE